MATVEMKILQYLHYIKKIKSGPFFELVELRPDKFIFTIA
jgi:hypothetical protein